jgi:hypothetical protein
MDQAAFRAVRVGFDLLQHPGQDAAHRPLNDIGLVQDNHDKISHCRHDATYEIEDYKRIGVVGP